MNGRCGPNDTDPGINITEILNTTNNQLLLLATEKPIT